MPPFLYTIILFSAVLWAGFIKIMFSTEPSNIRYIGLFLLFFLLAVSSTASIPLFIYLNKKSKNPLKHRHIFRRSIRISFIISAGITTFLALKAFSLINPLNALLFLIPYILILWQEIKVR